MADNGIYTLLPTSSLNDERLTAAISKWRSMLTKYEPLEDHPTTDEPRIRLGWVNDHFETASLVRPFSDDQQSLYRRPNLKIQPSSLRVIEGTKLERCGMAEWRHRSVFTVLGSTDKEDTERLRNSPVIQTPSVRYFSEPHHHYLGHRRNRLPWHRYRYPPLDYLEGENHV